MTDSAPLTALRLLHRFGADAPLVGVCWAYALMRMEHISAVSAEPLAAPALLLWAAALLLRGVPARDKTAQLLGLCVAAGAVWYLRHGVGRCFTDFLWLPLTLGLMGALLRHGTETALFAVALALLCHTPAAYASLSATPLQLLLSPETALLSLLFFAGMFWAERSRALPQRVREVCGLLPLLPPALLALLF